MTAIVEPESKPQPCRGKASAVGASDVEVERRIVLAATGLRKAFGGQVVLDGLNLELREGEVILLRGDNGSGKTTLINILTGNLEPDAGSIHYLADGSPREFRFPRRWWQELNPFDHFTPESTAREGIGRMWQDVRLFGSQSLRDNIAVAAPGQSGENPICALFAPGHCRLQESEIARQADAMLVRLGLAGRETSSGDKISLGQSKRVAIARAAAAGARILFLDEPLSGLDRQGIRHVMDLFESISREYAVTLVIVEHSFNYPHLHEIITTDWQLKAGKLLKNRRQIGKAATAIDDRSSSSIPACLTSVVKFAHEVIETPLPRGASLLRIRPAGDLQSPAELLLEVRGLIVQRGPRTVVGLDDERNSSGLDLNLYKGEIAILQAPNGWGKSTLLEALAGLAPVSAGQITFEGSEVSRGAAWKRRQAGIQLIPANGTSMQTLTVSEYASLAGITSLPDSLLRLGQRKMGTLSGGQSRLLAVASANSGSALCLFDEPFSMLDSRAIDLVAQFVQPSHRTATLIAIPTPNNAPP